MTLAFIVLRATRVQVLALKPLHYHGNNWLPLIGENPLKLEVDKCPPLIGENSSIPMKTSGVLALV